MHSRRSYGHWRLLLAEPRSGAENMARDTALLARAARTGETVFSVYSWQRPTLSFGRNQRARGFYDAGKVSSAGLDVVRRPTGGRAILHDREVTYSVTAPLEGAPPLREAYTRINEILLDGLARLGVAAEPALAGGRRAPAPTDRPCFETPTAGELVARGRKLVGSAQWRDDQGVLQHGSILVEDDQSSLSSFVTSGVDNEMIPVPATLASLLGHAPSPRDVAGAMFEAVRALVDSEAEELHENDVRAEALELVPRYLDEEWTWRR